MSRATAPGKRKLPAGITALPSGQFRWRVQRDGKSFSGTASTVTEAKQAKAAAETDVARAWRLTRPR